LGYIRVRWGKKSNRFAITLPANIEAESAIARAEFAEMAKKPKPAFGKRKAKTSSQDDTLCVTTIANIETTI
jgi:hypothetical protein